MPAEARRDADYIFHIGNVGSTLISRLLGELPTVFALREPLLLQDRRPRASSTRWRRSFRAPSGPEQRAMVKATSFTSEIADRMVQPGARALFLYATPDHYLENILAGENSWQTLQALSAIRLARLQSRCPGLDADLAAMHDGLKAALGWACEMTSLEAAAATAAARSRAVAGFRPLPDRSGARTSPPSPRISATRSTPPRRRRSAKGR